MDQPTESTSRRYWRANVRVVLLLLGIWFFVGCVLGIFFVEQLNTIKVGGFPLGFWFAQQGSIYVFIILIFVYARWMARIDRKFDVHERDES